MTVPHVSDRPKVISSLRFSSSVQLAVPWTTMSVPGLWVSRIHLSGPWPYRLLLAGAELLVLHGWWSVCIPAGACCSSSHKYLAPRRSSQQADTIGHRTWRWYEQIIRCQSLTVKQVDNISLGTPPLTGGSCLYWERGFTKNSLFRATLLQFKKNKISEHCCVMMTSVERPHPQLNKMLRFRLRGRSESLRLGPRPRPHISGDTVEMVNFWYWSGSTCGFWITFSFSSLLQNRRFFKDLFAFLI